MKTAIVHGGGISAAAARYGGRVEDWLDLSTGLNPCPPAIPLIAPEVWHRLPDRHLEHSARLAARDFYRSGTILPLPVPGTQSAIQLLPRLVDPGRRAAILSPTYGEYARVFAHNGYTVDAIGDLSQVGPEHGLAVVVNPNNPDGRTQSRAELKAIAERLARQGGLLIVDEAFADCTPETTVAGLVEETPGLVVFRSFGKFFGMAGVRLGFVVAQGHVLERMADWLGPWAVSGPALAMAASLMSEDPNGLREQINERRTALGQVLSNAGLMVAGGSSLFALVENPRASDLHEHLCRQHILTRKFDYAPAWLRIGLAPDATAEGRLAQALGAWKRI
ncbi:MAG: threonine-phosphate decarboxylase CobD [Rhizobium sp.]